MSENQSLSNSSDSSLMNSTEVEQSTSSQTDWEVASVPGTIDGAQNVARATKAIAPERENELLGLIHDLNQCNDDLLSRVSQLERALEKSQLALKIEVANAQAASGKMAQQVSVEQASAQQISQNAQQQIARLVNELDNTEQALNRQRLVNENLQTEVNNNQERISQLERECTVVAQQHLEEVQARAKAEAASRDLRSRLQRQQRYTMQFKAALEKSLTVTARSTGTSTAQPVSFEDSTAVVMPKAQRIMPWVSDHSSAFAGIDPHLESLIRGVGKSQAQAERLNSHKEVAVAKTVSKGKDSGAKDETDTNAGIDSVKTATAQKVEPTASSEAEAKLLQDLERVMNHAEGKVGESSADAIVEEQTVEVVEATDAVTPDAQPEAIPSELEETQASDDLIHQIERSFSTDSHSVPEETVTFTEPSPWGAPLSEKQSDQKLEKLAASTKTPLVRNSAEASAENSFLPATDSQVNSAVSPLVKPLRSQKKTSSLSDIELPTFQNAKVASFRR